MESEFFPRVGIDKLKSPAKLELVSNKDKECEKNCRNGSGYVAVLVRPKLQQFREKQTNKKCNEKPNDISPRLQ